MRNQPAVRPLPIQVSVDTEKDIDIHVQNGIRNHGPNISAVKESIRLRSLSYS
jgi:hypothetical protein